MSKAEELASTIAQAPDADGWHYVPSVAELQEAAAHLRALDASHQRLKEALTLMCRSRGSVNPIPPDEAYDGAYAALEQAKDL